MLPGIRFLFAAIVLSMSVLIFGLGAAALLRAAHEEVANIPTRRVMAEPVFAQTTEPPTLALLRVEPEPPAKSPEAPPAAPPEAVPVPKVETEKLAALRVDEVAVETTRREAAATAEIMAGQDAAPTETPALPAAAERPPSSETKLAALEAAPVPPAEPVSVAFEHVATPAMADTQPAATRTAALGSPAAKVEKPAQAKTGEKSDRAEIRKQQRAERAKERRRQAARRARLAAQQASATADPFSQPVEPATGSTMTAAIVLGSCRPMMRVSSSSVSLPHSGSPFVNACFALL